ncbi:hypothetical protein [Flavobacterium sp. W21_SRS_FM6]|uniref:hypothetical protein n=1 Tax=Flavobacterium sp. W21_SRS_FM6 TaxID=3240268 RepID=UPI003F8FE118
MKDYKQMFLKLADVMTAAEKIENLEQKILLMEKSISDLRNSDEDKWMSLKEAAGRVNKTTRALYQRIKDPKNLIPENKAWKQERPGAQMRVNLKELRPFI